MNINKLTSLSIFFLILGMPVVLTFCLNTGKNHYKELPVLGPKTVTENNDTIYHKIQPFELINHRGDSIKLREELKGKPFIAHFFSADCSGKCPEMFEYLHKVNERTRSNSELQILSISVDRQNQMARLRKFASAQNINADRWHLLTGDKDTIEQLATKSFLVTAGQEQADGSIMHSDLFVLVDKNRHIRGFYKGSDWNKVEQLMEEVVVLAVNEEQS